ASSRPPAAEPLSPSLPDALPICRTELILPEGAEVRLDSWVGLGGIVTPGEDLSGYGVRHEEVFGSAEEGADLPAVNVRTRKDPRSEEHTSELQSRFDIVCRLLLE